MRLLETKTCWSDEALVLWRLAGEALADEGHLGDHALPLVLLALTCGQHAEHFGIGDGLHLGDGNTPFAGLFFTLLLDGVTENLGTRDTFTIQ